MCDVAWEYRNNYICTTSDDQTLKIWDCASGACLRTFEGHTNFVFCCAFNPTTNVLVSGSFDETVRLWDYRDGRCLKVICCQLPLWLRSQHLLRQKLFITPLILTYLFGDMNVVCYWE